MEYNIISTGSHGNAVVLNDYVLIDCGVPFKSLKNVFKNLKIVLLTHEHNDHVKKSTIRKLAAERPTLRFACGDWLVPILVECDVSERNIDVLEIGKIYDYGAFKVSPIKLYHDVPNCGFRLFFGDKKVLYATDTEHLEGVSAKDYDLFMIEANYTEDDLKRRIEEKQKNGEYSYEMNAAARHLSKEQADAFLLENMGAHSRYEYLHGHIDKSDEWGYE